MEEPTPATEEEIKETEEQMDPEVKWDKDEKRNKK